MRSYNTMIMNSIANYKRRGFELSIKYPLGKSSELYNDFRKMYMSLVDGDFADVVASAPGFSLLVERVCRHGGLTQEEGVTLVTDFIASCLGLSSAPAEWVALGLDRASEGLGDVELHDRFSDALALVHGVLDAVTADSSDAYRTSLECHLMFLVDAGLGCDVPMAVA